MFDSLGFFDVVKIEVLFAAVLLRHAYISKLLFFLDVFSLSRICTAYVGSTVNLRGTVSQYREDIKCTAA